MARGALDESETSCTWARNADTLATLRRVSTGSSKNCRGRRYCRNLALRSAGLPGRRAATVDPMRALRWGLRRSLLIPADANRYIALACRIADLHDYRGGSGGQAARNGCVHLDDAIHRAGRAAGVVDRRLLAADRHRDWSYRLRQWNGGEESIGARRIRSAGARNK